MLFNSIDFAVFLPLVFILYWFVFKNNTNRQNLFLTLSSYVFYGWWDWRFLSLILFSTIVDYTIGIGLLKSEKQKNRKLLLWISILVNLGFLGFFKYYNFFVDNFIHAFSFFGSDIKANSLHLILPVGISFYTFQTLSYTIDVYRRKLEPTRNFFAFSSFVGFFPQLVAGPIERATHLLPQFYKKRRFNYAVAVDGMRQILWGLFKKVVIADNCAEFANEIFNHSADMNGSTLLLGAIFFTFQIYGDFSGYSDIAIGTSRLFGFDLKRNFAFPYFSRDIAEFWRRWHISLSTWFRDYLYIPLGGSKGSMFKKVRNVFIIFLVSGFWHGANWTFVLWGAVNAFYFVPLLLYKKNRNHIDVVAKNRIFPKLRELGQMTITFGLTTFAWIIFRAESVGHALEYIQGIFSSSVMSLPHFHNSPKAISTILLIVFMMLIEWIGRQDDHALNTLLIKKKRLVRWSFYSFVIFLMGMFMATEESPFIYFQF